MLFKVKQVSSLPRRSFLRRFERAIKCLELALFYRSNRWSCTMHKSARSKAIALQGLPRQIEE